MYGKNFGGEHGVSNVHRILGGHIDMQNRDDGGLDVKPTSMYSNMQNSDKSDLVPSKIMIRNSSDRNDMGIPNSRIFAARREDSLGFVLEGVKFLFGEKFLN
jgi:hypothetical protein